MGCIKKELAEPGQSVEGVIISFEQDTKLEYAPAVAPNISYYRCHISFKLTKQLDRP